MTENKLSIICSSFLKENPPNQLQATLSSISYISSPQHYTVQKPMPFFDFGGKCYSPRLYHQPSKLDLYSPATFSTMKQIESERKINTHAISKVKRTTLPAPLLKQKLDNDKFQGISTPKSNQKTRINFTYNQPQLHTSQTIGTVEGNKQSLVFMFESRASKAHSLFQSKNIKISRNRLCSCQFSQYFSPLQQVRRKSRQLRQLLKSLQLETELLTNRDSSSRDISKVSNVTQAESQRSGVGETKVSEVTVGSTRWDSQVQTGKGYLMGFDLAKPSLTDQIPTSKQLGKTIMLPSTSYDFGGLVPSIGEIENNSQGMTTNRVRDWDHLKELLYGEGEQDLKESIHCGPDIRAGSLNCEMLQGFGRQIKQSSIGYQD